MLTSFRRPCLNHVPALPSTTPTRYHKTSVLASYILRLPACFALPCRGVLRGSTKAFSCANMPRVLRPPVRRRREGELFKPRRPGLGEKKKKKAQGPGLDLGLPVGRAAEDQSSSDDQDEEVAPAGRAWARS